jgi:arginine-tRNA-protein transferase
MITGKSVCGYLPGRMTVFRAFETEELSPETYQRLMDAGFRRSGTLVYQPMCPGCRQCVPIRVPVARFQPSKSHRRVLRKNADLVVTVNIPAPSVEKYELYDSYQRQWHDGKQAGDPMGFLTFLYQSPVHTLEFEYRDPTSGTEDELTRGGKLLGVGICDLTPRALSSVYFYFDPSAARRSLGTFSVLYELAWAREHKLLHWYAGYWVKGCATMDYKARFQPAELLGTDGVWREMGAVDAELETPAADGEGPESSR